MELSFEETLVEVWRQALVENTQIVELGSERYPVRGTPKRGLRQVDFVFEGKEIRGLEQNPHTKSRWAQLARSGKKVMQFLSKGRYVATWPMPRCLITVGEREECRGMINSPTFVARAEAVIADATVRRANLHNSLRFPRVEFGSTVLAQNVANRQMYLQTQGLLVERAMGIEPTSEAWEA